jgi:hypothetical protein
VVLCGKEESYNKDITSIEIQDVRASIPRVSKLCDGCWRC